MHRLVYLAPVPWWSFTQRAHEFVRYFRAVSRGEVLWVDPYPTRLPSLKDIVRPRQDQSNSREKGGNWFQVIAPKALPIEPLPLGKAINRRLFWKGVIRRVHAFASGAKCILAIGKPSALAIDLLQEISFSTAVYDAMDDFPAFYRGQSRRSMERLERQVVASVERVFASSTRLVKRLSSLGCNPILLRNGLNSETFSAVHVERFIGQQSTIGYVGTVASWFDWELVVRLALAKPQFRIEIVGPVFQSPVSDLPGNVRLAAACDHAAAIAKMQEFAIGLIPFKRNRLTDSVDPIKYYEYRAIGLPVISTPFGEMVYRADEKGVFLVDESSNIVHTVETALKSRVSPEDVMRFRKENDWSTRFIDAGIFANL